jgi:hypothetical protein
MHRVPHWERLYATPVQRLLTIMRLNDEEQDVVADKSGPVALQALQHQLKKWASGSPSILPLQFSSWSVFDRIWRLFGKERLLGKEQSLKPTQVAEIEQPIDHALRDVVRARIIDLLAASKDKPVVQAEHSGFQPGDS